MIVALPGLFSYLFFSKYLNRRVFVIAEQTKYLPNSVDSDEKIRSLRTVST